MDVYQHDVVFVQDTAFLVTGACESDGDLALFTYMCTFNRHVTTSASSWTIGTRCSLVDLVPGLRVCAARGWSFVSDSELLILV